MTTFLATRTLLSYFLYFFPHGCGAFRFLFCIILHRYLFLVFSFSFAISRSTVRLAAIHIVNINGHVAETAIVDYRLSFDDQGKQTSVFHFRLQQTYGNLPFLFPFAENKRKLPFSVISIFRLWNSGNMETWKYGDMEMETWRHGNMETWKHGNMEK